MLFHKCSLAIKLRAFTEEKPLATKKRAIALVLRKSYFTILILLQNSHWTLLMGQSVERGPRRPRSETTLSDHETKRREAVWELFHSEVIYLMSHLLVLKEVRIGWSSKNSPPPRPTITTFLKPFRSFKFRNSILESPSFVYRSVKYCKFAR